MKSPVDVDTTAGASGAPKPAPEQEGDALLDMLFDDAREDRKGAAEAEAPARAPAAPPPFVAAPLEAVAPPPPPAEEAEVDLDEVALDERATHPGDLAIEPPAVASVPAAPVPELATTDDASVRVDDAAAAYVDDAVVDAAAEAVDEAPADGAEVVAVALSAAQTAALPSRQPPAVAFDHEEDASALLLKQQQRDAWVQRAEWLRAEAEAQKSDAQRARTLLAVSELYAMAGEEPTARSVAEEALRLAPTSPLAHRQVRGIIAREGSWAAVLDALDGETRAAPTPEAKIHGLLLGAEIARICSSDEEGAKKRLDQAQRTLPSDPRPHVQRLGEALAAPEPDEADEAKPSALSRVKIPEMPELEPLPSAAHLALAHRGLTPPTRIGKRAPAKAAHAPGTIYEAVLRARASAAGGDYPGVIASLEHVAGSPSLAGGAHWLVGVLAAVRNDTRPRAVAAFKAVTAGSHPAFALRALAARAIELGDAAAARAATDSSDADAFSAADRVVLASLAGSADRETIAPWLGSLSQDADLAAIAAAAYAALGGDEDPAAHAVGGPRAQASAILGRALGKTGSSALRRAIEGFAEASPEASLGRLLTLELDAEDRAGAKIAHAISTWRDDAELERERGIAGALIAEAAGDIDAARVELDRVRVLDASNESIARAAASHVDAGTAAQIIAEHAQTLPGGSRAAILLVEAAVRLARADDPNESDALLRRALEADPELPLAHHLGERAARARGDRDALIEWIRVRREASADPPEQAHDLVREAMLLSEGDASAAAPLLEAALRARPTDVALREIYERLATEPPADRAQWRADRAVEATGGEAARLWLEAALELERTGDVEGVARAAQRAIAAGDALLAPVTAYRAALAGHGAADLVDQLLPKVRESEDPVERLEIYERLAELDERGRGDAASALLWRRTILEETVGHLPTLRRVASTLVGAGRDEELEPIALDIARVLEGPESVAHAMLAARLHQRTGTWDETREAVEIAYRHQPRGIWALRQMAAHARAKGDASLALESDRALLERTDRASEGATLALRASESALKAGLLEDALAFLGQAKGLTPEHVVLHLHLAAALEQTDNAAGAASALEEAAAACTQPSEQARLLYRAAKLWHDKAEDPARAREALEAVAAIDPSYEDVFQRLQAIYVAAGARAELAALLERRLEAVTDPAERVEMEVLRGRALADVGDAAAAKRALAAALDANPDHVDALSAFGEVSAAEEDWPAAEQAWIRLARLVPDPERQTAIYFRLGELYDERLPNPERAELAYQEILKHAPSDTRAREKLVALYQKTGDASRAIEQQTLLVNSAETPEAKCERTTQLAAIYEGVGDAKKAEATLLQARKTWPKDDVALAALAHFYLRTNQAQAANVLLDRAVADARRALATGRFEPYLFSTIAAVAELRNRPDAARVAKAAVASLEGGDAALEGAGLAAADAKLDDLLAPEVLTVAFRDLLARTGALLDSAIPFDLASVRAAPLPPQLADLAELIHRLAAGYGLPSVQVYTSNVLGSVCLPVSTHPPVLVLGQPLVASDRDDVKTFLIHRALKILQGNAAAISRTAPIDLWPLLAAYLRAFNNTWVPQGVDQGKLTDFYGRITRALPKTPDTHAGTLAAEVIGSIGNRASTLNTVINGWGNRAGLLAVGDLNVAISGIAWAGGHPNAPPAAGKDRMTWIGRNAEARELVVFSVTDAYADARSNLGLGAADADISADVSDVSDVSDAELVAEEVEID